jgi:ParB family transcriptional regulator, chromosome partitioning protein
MSQSIIDLPIDAIEVGQRLRSVDPAWVSAIAVSFQETGQHTPVQVGPADDRGKHALIAGAHRLAAAREAGLPTLQAIVFHGDALMAQLLEVDENLIRRGLSELDRAFFLARRKALYLALHPETKRGGDRKSGRKNQTEQSSIWSGRTSFADDVAAKIGLSGRQIRKFVRRAELGDEIKALMAHTRWADHGATLDGLLKLPPAQRLAAATALSRADNPARNLAAASSEGEARSAPPRSDDDIKSERLLKAWKQAPAKVRESFLAFLMGDDGIADRLEELLAARGPDRLATAVAKGRR